MENCKVERNIKRFTTQISYPFTIGSIIVMNIETGCVPMHTTGYL